MWEKSWNLFQKWRNCFMHRNYLNFRRSTHIYQKILRIKKMQEFFSITFNIKANIIWN